MRHEASARMGTIVDKIVAEQIGFQTADAIPADSLHLIKGLHQINKALASRLPEVTYVHTRQYYLLATFTNSLFCLFHQRGNSRVTTETTCIGYGAIGTEIVAAILHLQEEARTVATRATGSKRLDVLRLHNIVLLRRHPTPRVRKILYQARLLIRTQNQVHTLYLRNKLSIKLGIASGDNYKGTGMLAYHAVYSLTALMVGHVSHRASIDQTYISLLALGGRAYAECLQRFPKSRSFREIQLTA